MNNDYKITSQYDPERYIFVYLDGKSFTDGLNAKLYLTKKCGFTVYEANGYIELLPEGKIIEQH